ncbi:hypothetical protein QZH41_015180 [Actinostola sp. cb2023]|nr:hypothetical protein QZH41_015180 [Actinostola sp. cb2023]
MCCRRKIQRGDVREFHVQPGLSPILPSRKLSEPEHSRKYSDPVPPYRKISSDILSYRERTRTISESTLSGPATPLGSLDPQLYAFELLEI